MSVKKVIDCIRRNKTFLITSHQNLEGDALGSEISFYNLLRKSGKSAAIINHDPVPREYTFLKGARLIKKYRHNMKIKADVLVLLDCSDKSRCGCVWNLAAPGQTIINIDHHISNTGFGDVSWVKPCASSVAEMIYQLYKAMNVRIDAETAKALYVGILTDTGSFRYPNTTALTHQIAARLLKSKLDVAKIYRNIYESVSFSDMSLLSRILLTLSKDATGKIIMFRIKKQLLEGKRVRIDLSENVLNFGRLIQDCEVCVLFKEQQGKTRQMRVNLRSKGLVDVNRIAQFFGGGGHKTASGCTISG
ncbi:MAG: bifunctional oligoribonuclease/PAP phosphatase NrnA, partial [Candidatus Omnitrophota bacterium]